MGAGAWVVFFLALAAWYSVREAVALTETQRRIMWVATVGAMALPAFTSLASHPWVINVAWPFLAGVMAGELAWGRIQVWKFKKLLAEKAAQDRALEQKRARKRAKREG